MVLELVLVLVLVVGLMEGLVMLLVRSCSGGAGKAPADSGGLGMKLTGRVGVWRSGGSSANGAALGRAIERLVI